MKKLKITYVGKDSKIVKDLDKAYQSRSDKYEVEMFHVSDFESESSLAEKLFSKSFNILILDFSTEEDLMMDIACRCKAIIFDDNMFMAAVIKGPSDESASDSKLNEEIFEGLFSLNIKCYTKGMEYDGLVFDSLYDAFKDKENAPVYATYKNVHIDGRVNLATYLSYVTKKAIYFEGHIEIPNGDTLKLDCDYEILKNKVFTVKANSSENQSQMLSFKTKLGVSFKRPIQRPEGVTTAQTEEEKLAAEKARLQYEEEVLQNNRSVEEDEYYKWIEDYKNGGTKYYTQDPILLILCIQKSANLLAGPRLQTNKIIMRLLTSLDNIEEVIAKLRPDVITFENEIIESEESEDDSEVSENTETPEGEETVEVKEVEMPEDSNSEEFSNLISICSNTSGYDPYICVFNTQVETTQISAKYNNTKIIADPEFTNNETIAKAALMSFKDESQKKSYRSYNLNDEGPGIRVFPSATNNILKINMPITITSLSEHFITFSIDAKLNLGMTLNFTEPALFNAIVIEPTENLSNEGIKFKNHYMASIYGIDAENIQQLRRYVNSLFLMEKRSKEASELDEFKKKNEEALNPPPEETEGSETEEGAEDTEKPAPDESDTDQ